MVHWISIETNPVFGTHIGADMVRACQATRSRFAGGSRLDRFNQMQACVGMSVTGSDVSYEGGYQANT